MFYHVFCINQKETRNTFFEKNVFFQSCFTLFISSLSFTLLIMLLHNLLISLDRPLNCIYAQVSIKVETYKVVYSRKPKLVWKVHTQLHSIFLSCSIIITQLLWISSKSGLQFTCFIQTLNLHFKDWTFGVIVTRHFRQKSSNLNKRVYCKPIDRTFKMIYIHWKVG